MGTHRKYLNGIVIQVGDYSMPVQVKVNKENIEKITNYLNQGGFVESVNEKTGEVVLTASDIKASNNQTIQNNLERIDEEINRVEGRFEDLETYENVIEGSKYISFDRNEDEDKLQITFDFTHLNEFIEFPSTQEEVVLSWESPTLKKIKGKKVKGKKVKEENTPLLKAVLNNNVSNKINNSLQFPLQTPTSNELVGINTSKNQTRITIGSGLVLSNNVLSAGGSSGTSLFKHKISYNDHDLQPITIDIITNFDTPIIATNLNSKSWREENILSYGNATQSNDLKMGVYIRVDDNHFNLVFLNWNSQQDNIFYTTTGFILEDTYLNDEVIAL